MTHGLSGALQQASRIRQRRAVKEPDVYVRSEYIDAAERRVSQTCNRAAVVQELPNFIPAFSHYLKPLMRDGSQLTCMLFHPPIDGGIPLDGAVKSQQFRSHHHFSSPLPGGTPLRRRMILSNALKSARAFRFVKNSAVCNAETFSATAVATNWFMLVRSSRLIRATASFSDRGSRKGYVRLSFIF
jgi:hypothetical protein